MFIKYPIKSINNTKRKYVILIYTLVIFSAGILFKNTGIIGNIIKPNVKSYSKIFFSYLKSILANPEHITINIKHKDYQKILNVRKRALNKGILIISSDDYDKISKQCRDYVELNHDPKLLAQRFVNSIT